MNIYILDFCLTKILKMSENKAMSVGEWMVTMLVTAIPLVGFIMLFVWAFSDGTNPNKKSWARASLVFFAIIIVLYFVVGAAALVGMASYGY